MLNLSIEALHNIIDSEMKPVHYFKWNPCYECPPIILRLWVHLK